MTLSEYNEWAKTKRRKGTPDADWRNAALGFAGEFGEICDLIKKHEFHGHELDKEKLKLELGDLLFYFIWLWDLSPFAFGESIVYEVDFFDCVSEMSNVFFITGDVPFYRDFQATLSVIEDFAALHFDKPYEDALQQIMQANMDKLNTRYPNGFSEAASQNRLA